MELDYIWSVYEKGNKSFNYFFNECSREKDIQRMVREFNWLKDKFRENLGIWVKNFKCLGGIEDEDE